MKENTIKPTNYGKIFESDKPYRKPDSLILDLTVTSIHVTRMKQGDAFTMIYDKKILSEIAKEWSAVVKLCAASHRQSLIPGSGFINETPPETFYNLPFLLAYAVLDQVLTELKDQGSIQCNMKRPLLGCKMVDSKNVVPWQNYPFIETGKDARNELAHEAVLLSRNDCFAFISAIKTELKAWGVLE